MALDPRIALQGVSWQAPDIQGAMARGQEYRQNQMAMQAAETTAQRNMMARQRAAAVDPSNRPQVNAFVNEVGADVAAPYLEAWNNVGGMFRAEAEEGRAAGKYTREARGEDRGFMQNALAAVYNDPSDANIAAVRAQALAAGIPEADFDAYASRFLAAPVEQRRSLLANELATTEEGRKVLTTFAPEWERENRGGTIGTIQTNPLVPGAAPPAPATVTPSPNRPVIMNTDRGVYSATPGDPTSAQPFLDANGQPLMPYVAPRAVPATDALGAQAASADTLRDVLGQLRTNFDVLYQNGFMRGGGVSPVGNLAQFVGDLVPGVRGARLSTNSAADTASGNVEALLSTAISTLSALYGTSSRVMDAVKEMENARSTFGGQNLTIEAARNMVDTALRRVDELEAARVDAGGGGGSGGGQVAYDAQGNRFVVRNGQWVRE